MPQLCKSKPYPEQKLQQAVEVPREFVDCTNVKDIQLQNAIIVDQCDYKNTNKNTYSPQRQRHRKFHTAGVLLQYTLNNIKYVLLGLGLGLGFNGRWGTFTPLKI